MTLAVLDSLCPSTPRKFGVSSRSPASGCFSDRISSVSTMRRPSVPAPRALIAFAVAAVALSGCGKTGAPSVAGGGPLRHLAPIEAQGAVSLTTRNTARVGGADTTVDAAAVARVVYPGITAGSRPQAVVL